MNERRAPRRTGESRRRATYVYVAAALLLAGAMSGCTGTEGAGHTGSGSSPAAPLGSGAITARGQGGDGTGPPSTVAPLSAPARVSGAPERIRPFDDGPWSRGGALDGGSVVGFVFAGGAGQALALAVDSDAGSVLPAVVGDDGTTLKYHTDGETAWSGELPAAQDYFVHLVNTSDSPSGYRLTIAPDATALSAVAPTYAAESPSVRRVELPEGQPEVYRGDLAPDRPDIVAFDGLAGLVLVAAASRGEGEPPTLALARPDGRPLGQPQPGVWRGELPGDETYQLVVDGSGVGGAYALALRLVRPTVMVEPSPGNEPRDEEAPILVSGEAVVPPGGVGGGRVTVPSLPGRRLVVSLTEAPEAPDGFVTVRSASGDWLERVDPVIEGRAYAFGPLPGDVVVSVMFPGGAAGRTASYRAALAVE